MDGLLLDTERQMYAKFGEEASAEMGRPMSLDFLTTVMGGSKELYRNRVLSVYGEDYPYDGRGGNGRRSAFRNQANCGGGRTSRRYAFLCR